jgi:hypothetical protein
MKHLFIALLFSLPLLAQNTGSPVSVVAFRSSQPFRLFDYDGSNNLIYTAETQPFIDYSRIVGTSAFRWTRAASTLTNIVVSSNTGTITTSTAHGLSVDQQVCVTGATVDTDLNACYNVITVGSTTTATITTANVANATYTDATMVLSTNAPLTTQAIWSICKYTYTTNNLVKTACAGGAAKSQSFIWDNRAVATGATRIFYD